MDAFISLERYSGKPVVKVRIGGKHRRYPLTRAGCLLAGRDLSRAGVESWINSSSVDFPQETKPRCRLDVRELIGQGFAGEEDKENAPKYSMYRQLMAFASEHNFAATLSSAEQAAFDELKAHIIELTKGK